MEVSQPQLDESGTENLLYETCIDVIEKRTGVDSLQNAYQNAQEELKETRTDFDLTVSEQSKKIQLATRNLVAQINNAFDEYKSILDKIGLYFHSFDQKSLEESSQKLPEISDKLEKLFFEYRDLALTSMGPSKIASLNLVVDTMNRINKGEDLFEKLAFHVESESLVLEDIMEEMEQGEETEELLARKEASLKFLEAMDTIAEFLETDDESLFDRAEKELNQAVEMYNSLPGVIDHQDLAKSPTRSPLANIVINSAKGLKDGSVTPEFFGEALQRLWDELDMMKFRFNTLSGTQEESSMVQEESEILEEIIIAYEEVLNEYFDALETWNLENFDELEEKLKNIVLELYESMKAFERISESEGKIPCVHCGNYNPAGSRFCEKCNFKLPEIAQEKSSRLDMKEGGQVNIAGEEAPVMTQNVKELFESAQMAAEGKMDFDEFVGVIEWMESLLQQAYKAAGPIPPTKLEKLKGDEKDKIQKVDSLLKEASDVYQKGLEEFEVGLSFFRQFAEGGSHDSIQAGSRMIMQGMGKLQKVQKVTEAFVK